MAKRTPKQRNEEQELHDFMLLVETLQQNPFSAPKLERRPIREKIAERLNSAEKSTERNHRNCADRVRDLFTAFKKKDAPVTGDGTVPYSANEYLIRDIVQEQEKAEAYKEDEKKKSDESRASIELTKKAALENLSKQKNCEDVENSDIEIQGHSDDLLGGVEEDGLSSIFKNPTAKLRSSSPKKSRSFRRSNMKDASAEYLRDKMDLQRKESERKAELQKLEFVDREKQRELQREQFSLKKQKMELEAKERERRFEADQQDRQLMRHVLMSFIDKNKG